MLNKLIQTSAATAATRHEATRRGFLIGSAAVAGGLIVGLKLVPFIPVENG